MNNLVLQKLLHAHQLIKPETYTEDMDNQRVDTAEARTLERMFEAPRYFTGLKNTVEMVRIGGDTDKRTQVIPTYTFKKMLKGYAQEVSQAAKFYIDKRGTEFLNAKEYEIISSELKVYAPYKSTFLQIEDDETVYNILCMDNGDKSDTDEPILYMCMLPYIKDIDCFVFDLNVYAFCYHENTEYTYWLKDSPLSEYVDTETDSNNQYTNRHLEVFVSNISTCWITFMILLQYPQITDTREVKGRQNIFLDMHTKFKASTLRAKPSFQHKELKINLYGNAPSTNNTISNNDRSSGTAFHSVRKHLRTLSNGKHTFVKAHFRGAKAHGVITKDYVINI